MTFALTAAVAESFDVNVTDNSGGLSNLAAINNADPEAARLLLARPRTFSAEATTAGNDTENVANALMRLGTGFLAVPFPVGSQRRLTVRVWAHLVGVADFGYVEKVVTVVGAATPVVRQDTTGAISVALAIPVAAETVAGGGAYVLPIVTGEVGGVFINVRNVAAAAIQTAVAVGGAGIRVRVECMVDSLVTQPSP